MLVGESGHGAALTCAGIAGWYRLATKTAGKANLCCRIPESLQAISVGWQCVTWRIPELRDGSMVMKMEEFEQRAAAVLEAISDTVDAADLDCDLEQKGDGVLEITLTNGSRIIVNRHVAAGEIWVAAKSGGYHFRFDGKNWVNTRDGGELFSSISRYLSEQLGKSVMLQPWNANQ